MTEAEAKKRHAALAAQIRAYDHAYYVEARPTIGDAEYDRLYRELLDIETQFPELCASDSPSQRVGGHAASAFAPVRHAAPMLSLDNTYSEGEVREFVGRVQKLLPSRGTCSKCYTLSLWEGQLTYTSPQFGVSFVSDSGD